MASDKLQKILAMSKNIDKKGSKSKQTTPQKVFKTPMSIHEQTNKANQAIADIDAMYNSPYVPTKEEKEAWNTERGREELTEMADKNVFMQKLNQSKLPSAILESMRQNPCNYDPSIVNSVMGPENALYKKLNEVYGKEKETPKSGVQAIHQIEEQLKERDKKSNDDKQVIEESVVHESSDFSLSQLEEMIERVIDRKLNSLNESMSRTTNSIKSMSLTESGNFRFLDTENNVYECQMKYLGKRKKKK
jgi:hypothetical protein